MSLTNGDLSAKCTVFFAGRYEISDGRLHYIYSKSIHDGYSGNEIAIRAMKTVHEKVSQTTETFTLIKSVDAKRFILHDDKTNRDLVFDRSE